MPFKKGNTLWKEGIATKLKKQDKINEFFLIAGNGGVQRYGDFLDKLGRGEGLEKSELEFCDRFEKLFPYMKARKTDITSNDKELTPLLVKFIKDAN